MSSITDDDIFSLEHPRFTRIYDEHWRQVLGFTRLYINDSYEQEEIVQEVFIRLWEMRASINDDSNIDGLLFIITRNMIFDRRRRSLNYNAIKEELAFTAREQYDIEGQIDADDLSEYIDKLVEALPPRQRETFILSRRHYLSHREIAEKLNISERGVERNLYLALKFLRRHLPLFMIFMHDSVSVGS